MPEVRRPRFFLVFGFSWVPLTKAVKLVTEMDRSDCLTFNFILKHTKRILRHAGTERAVAENHFVNYMRGRFFTRESVSAFGTYAIYL